MIASPTLLAGVQPSTRTLWSHIGAAVIPASDPSLAAWLSDHHCHAVVLRPDRYIAGLAQEAPDLDALCEHLPGAAVALH